MGGQTGAQGSKKRGGEEDISTAPFGFQLLSEFYGHRGSKFGCKQAVYNQDTDTFASVDENGFRTWSRSQQGGSKEVHEVSNVHFPSAEKNMIAALIYIPQVPHRGRA